MKAAVLRAVGAPLTVEEVDLSGPGPNEVLIRVVASGVCHSDLHVMEGVLPYPLPTVLGHEAAGVVEDVGPGVSALRRGAHVVVAVVPSCGRCRLCLRGRPNLCTAIRGRPGVMADGTRRLRLPGGEEVNHFTMISSFAQFAVVHEAAAVPVREDIPLERACLLGCGLLTGWGAAVNRARVAPGSSCVVLGCGGVGLGIVQGCAVRQAEPIVAVDLWPQRLEVAARLGATHTLLAGQEDVPALVRQLTGGGADYVFDAVGSPQTAALALSCLGRGGTAVLVGVGQRDASLSVPITATVLNERAVLGCDYGSAWPQRDIALLADMYAAGRLKLDELVDRTYPLEGVNEALADLKEGRALRPVILPWGDS
ncbi:NDMA-dependent alcohol dehydrogenase [bacterium HR24]|nr:NDMA-dependent alcohol dehydrogenase [bacterium HR24]